MSWKMAFWVLILCTTESEISFGRRIRGIYKMAIESTRKARLRNQGHLHSPIGLNNADKIVKKRWHATSNHPSGRL